MVQSEERRRGTRLEAGARSGVGSERSGNGRQLGVWRGFVHGSNDRVHQFFGREDDFYWGVAGARKRESDSEVRGVDPRARCYELA